jgi:hypothetical protein
MRREKHTKAVATTPRKDVVAIYDCTATLSGSSCRLVAAKDDSFFSLLHLGGVGIPRGEGRNVGTVDLTNY